MSIGSFFKKIADTFIKYGTIVNGDISKLEPVVSKDIPEIAPFVNPVAALIQATLGRAVTTVIDIKTALGQVVAPVPVPAAGSPGVAMATALNTPPLSITGPQTAELAALELFENFNAGLPQGAVVNQQKAMAAFAAIAGSTYDLWNSVEVTSPAAAKPAA